MNFDHQTDRRLITGVSGTGKTTLFVKMVRKQKARLKFVYDHQGEFQRKLGFPAVNNPEDLLNRTLIGGYVIFDPIDWEGRHPEGFAFFCDFVFEVSKQVKGRKLICCDEIQMLTDNKSEPLELLKIMDSGRRYEIDSYFISNAPNGIHNRVRNQFTEVWSFRQADDNAVKYLESVCFPGERLRALPDYHYLWRNLKTGQNNFPTDAKAQPEGKGNPEPAGKGPETTGNSTHAANLASHGQRASEADLPEARSA